MVVIVAFRAHFLKEVARSQLVSASKSLLASDIRKLLNGADKSQFLVPLAKAFVNWQIVRGTSGGEY